MIDTITPGIHRDLGARYYKLGGDPKTDPENAILSKSLLWKFFPNPRKWRESPPFKPTAAMQWGSLVDCLALTPGEWDDRYFVGSFPTGRHVEIVDAILSGLEIAECPFYSFRPKAAQEWKAGMEEAGNFWVKAGELDEPTKHARLIERGIEVVSPEQAQEASIAASKLRAHPMVAPLLESCEKQVAAVAEIVEPTTGIRLKVKCLLDLADFEERRVIDFKTTRDASSERSLQKNIFEFGYYAQLAWYSCLLAAVTGERWDRYELFFQESVPPYYTTPPIPVEEDAINLGRKWIADALRKWCECALLGEWDAHDPCAGITSLDLPFYAYKDR